MLLEQACGTRKGEAFGIVGAPRYAVNKVKHARYNKVYSCLGVDRGCHLWCGLGLGVIPARTGRNFQAAAP